ncbi:MAG: hypothetical protein PHG85_03845 [Candidatus Altiarchaeota archaeon]|nr:hypothetical protein [Candidatus Altiarchaeota archaeon]
MATEFQMATMAGTITAAFAIMIGGFWVKASSGGIKIPGVRKVLEWAFGGNQPVARIAMFIGFALSAVAVTFFSKWIRSQLDHAGIGLEQEAVVTVMMVVVLYFLYDFFIN